MNMMCKKFLVFIFLIKSSLLWSNFLYTYNCQVFEGEQKIQFKVSLTLPLANQAEITKIFLEKEPLKFPFNEFSLAMCQTLFKPGYGAQRYFHCRHLDFLQFETLKLYTWTTSGGDHMRGRFDNSLNFVCTSPYEGF